MLGLGLTAGDTSRSPPAFGLGATLVLATDGLVERQDAVIDVGLDHSRVPSSSAGTM